MKKREKVGEILNKKENKNINFRKKSNASPLTDLFLKKSKNGGGGTKTLSAAVLTNGLNDKTALVTSPPPKRNV